MILSTFYDRIIAQAELCADQHAGRHIDTKHLLQALLVEGPEDPSLEVLMKSPSLKEITRDVRTALGVTTSDLPGHKLSLIINPRYSQVLACAAAIAIRLEAPQINGLHILGAIMLVEEGTAYGILKKHGLWAKNIFTCEELAKLSVKYAMFAQPALQPA